MKSVFYEIPIPIGVVGVDCCYFAVICFLFVLASYHINHHKQNNFRA